MKNRTIRVIALAFVLLSVVAGGVFLLTRNATVPVSPDQGTADGDSLSTDTNKPKLVRTYDLQTTEKREGNHMLESLMVVNDGRPAVVIEGQIRDLVTREVICTLPDAVYNSGPLAEGQTRSSYFCIGPNQTIDAVHVDQETEQVFVQSYSFDGQPIGDKILLPECSAQKYENEADDGMYAMIARIRSDKQRIYLLNPFELQVFDRNGALLYTVESAHDFAPGDDGFLYVICGSPRRGLSRLDVRTGSESYFVAMSGVNLSHIVLSPEGQSLYIQTDAEISRYNPQDGQLEEKTFSFASESHIVDTRFVSNFFCDKQGVIYILLRLDGGYGDSQYGYEEHIYTPTYAEEVPIVSQLTLTAPYYDPWVESAILRYEKQNPGHKIEYDYECSSYQTWIDATADGEYFTRMKTRILTGDIGDILWQIVTEQDIRSFTLTDLFAPWPDSMKDSELYASLDPVALQGLTIDGKLCAVPLDTQYYAARVNTKMLDDLGVGLDLRTATWGQVFDLVPLIEEKIPDGVLFRTFAADRIISRMVTSNIPNLVDIKNKTVDLHQPWFLELIEKTKRAWQSQAFCQEGNYAFSAMDNALLYIDIMTEQCWPQDLVAQHGIAAEKTGYSLGVVPLFAGEQNTNRTAANSRLLFVNRRSMQQEQAWEFISLLLSEEMQTQFSLQKIPVNLNARIKQIDEGISNTQTRDLDAPWQFGYTDETIAAWRDDMENVFDSVDAFYSMGEIQMDLWVPLVDYLNDRTTLDDALTKAEKNIWIRINE